MASFEDYDSPINVPITNGTLFFKYLETHGFPQSSETWKWTNVGVGWMFAYHHEEAIYCLEQARIHSDNKNIAVLWAISYCNLPNYNHEGVTEKEGVYPSMFDVRKFMKLAENLVSDDIKTAKKAKFSDDTLENNPENELVHCLINALKIQLSVNPYPACLMSEKRVDLQNRYAKKLYSNYPKFENDSLFCAIMVESIMAQRPWMLYDQKTREPVPADDKFLGTKLAHEILASGLKKFPDHLGLNHFAIHVHEMSLNPAIALPSCRVFRNENVSQKFGHLWHMPSHITTQTGHWLEAVECSIKAVKANNAISEKYRDRGVNCINGEKAIPGKLYFAMYRGHDVHMLAYASNFCGQYSKSLKACEEFRQEIMELPSQDPVYWEANKGWMDGFLTPIFHVFVRFGKWDEITRYPEQTDTHVASQLAHSYAKCMAFSNTDKLPEAKSEYLKFKTFHQKANENGLFMYNNSFHETYKIADKIIQAEILYREMENDSDFSKVIELLQDSVELDSQLNYIEPWGWMHPARQIIGALCLEQNRFLELALDCYLQDMGMAEKDNAKCPNPGNIWSVRGLLELEEKCKENEDLKKAFLKKVDFDKVREMLPELERNCESEITASCACKASWKPVD